jgi:hypothetical protein
MRGCDNPNNNPTDGECVVVEVVEASHPVLLVTSEHHNDNNEHYEYDEHGDCAIAIAVPVDVGTAEVVGDNPSSSLVDEPSLYQLQQRQRRQEEQQQDRTRGRCLIGVFLAAVLFIFIKNLT